MDWPNLVNGAFRVGSLIYGAANSSKRSREMASSVREMAERVPTKAVPSSPTGDGPPRPSTHSTTGEAEPASKIEALSPLKSKYSETSQISAEGKACVPCGSSHFQTVAGGLAEAMRFARSGGIAHPEVIERINASETELNTFERWDGAPEKVALLEGDEKRLMDDMLNASREMRHRLSDIKTVDELEEIAAKVGPMSKDFRARLFQMQIGIITPEQAKDIHQKAEAIRAKLGEAVEPQITLEEAKTEVARLATEAVEKRWESSESL